MTAYLLVLMLASPFLVACRQSEYSKRLDAFAQDVEAKAAAKRGFTESDVKAYCKLSGFSEREVYSSPAVRKQFDAFRRGEDVATVPKDYTTAIITAGALAGSR